MPPRPPPPPEVGGGGLKSYDGEVAYVDRELGRIVDSLAATGVRKRTLVVVTADHGESLGEHGEASHAFFLYQAPMRVPLVFSLPGALPATRVVSRNVSLLDVAPTILEAIGVDGGDQAQGRSLLPLIYSDPVDWADRPVAMETMAPWYQHGWSPSYALIKDGFKYIDARTPELYDLRADSNETDNLVHSDRAKAEAMAKELQDLRAGYATRRLGGGDPRQLDDEQREQLAELGYVYTGPTRSDPSPDAPDVKDMVDVMQQIQNARALKSAGRVSEAVAVLEQVLSENPNDRRVLNHLGVWLDSAGQKEKAIEYLERLVALDPDFSSAYVNLVPLYIHKGDFDKARVAQETLIELTPESAKAWVNYGILEASQGNNDAALEHFATALRLAPHRHEAHINMAVVYGERGEYEKALEASRTALEIKPQSATYRSYVERYTRALQN